MTKCPCLKIPTNSGEKALNLVKGFEIFNSTLRIKKENNLLYIPLYREPIRQEQKKLKQSIPTAEVCMEDFATAISKPKTFIDVLAEQLPPHLVASLPRSADFVGDIAVLEIPPELDGYKREIGEAILSTNKRVHTILAKAGAVEGVYRTRKFDVIAGEAKTATVHREYGCVFHVDLSKAYFSPRLSSEHVRVARLVNEGETVIDMFAGVGPFAVQIAKHHEKVRVYAVDVNPDAVDLLNRNIAANRVLTKVTPILGDIREIIHKRLAGTADRVIMNLPEKALEYVDVACEAIKPSGGIMHYYAFTNASEPSTSAEVRLVEAVDESGRKVEKILLSKTVRATAPFTWHVVVDAQII